jgi:hypothetical protein
MGKIRFLLYTYVRRLLWSRGEGFGHTERERGWSPDQFSQTSR